MRWSHPKGHQRAGRFIEACLLSLLQEKSSYGYGLLEQLLAFGFDEQEIPMSLVYRNLRAMESEGLVTSSWSQSDAGPDKKMYAITQKGKEELRKWIVLLKERKKRIELIIQRCENQGKEQ
ncbi:MAG: PadR family transcriptional regulator [Sphaerochaetaceae bacterium]